MEVSPGKLLMWIKDANKSVKREQAEIERLEKENRQIRKNMVSQREAYLRQLSLVGTETINQKTQLANAEKVVAVARLIYKNYGKDWLDEIKKPCPACDEINPYDEECICMPYLSLMQSFDRITEALADYDVEIEEQESSPAASQCICQLYEATDPNPACPLHGKPSFAELEEFAKTQLSDELVEKTASIMRVSKISARVYLKRHQECGLKQPTDECKECGGKKGYWHKPVVGFGPSRSFGSNPVWVDCPNCKGTGKSNG